MEVHEKWGAEENILNPAGGIIDELNNLISKT
jgi:hypothetical protein